MSHSEHSLRVQCARRALRSQRRGAMLVLIVLMLPVVLILAAFAINVSYIELTRTDMRVASDAAARAAGREFSLTGDQVQAIVVGKDAASRNKVGNIPLQLQGSDFVFGEATRVSESTRYTFDPAGTSPNAVQVSANRTSTSSGGSVPLLLPPLPNSWSSPSSPFKMSLASSLVPMSSPEVAPPMSSPVSASTQVADNKMRGSSVSARNSGRFFFSSAGMVGSGVGGTG